MSQPVYGNINTDGTQRTDRQTKRNQTGSDCVKIRRYRAAAVCLGLLCVLLLTAVIVLSVYFYMNNTKYTQETHKLLTRITELTEKSDELTTNITNLTEERDELIRRKANLMSERDQLINHITILDGWTYYKHSFYHMSSETKTWSESRRDCRNRKADLVIINNKEEQEFVMNIARNQEFFIGLTDNDVEGRWKWVDGTNMTSGFWASYGNTQEPNGGTKKNCVVTHLKEKPELIGWIDVPCNNPHQWICEKSILPLIQP